MAGLQGSKKPRPFQRPSIDIGGSPVKREWRSVLWTELSPGDTVADYGTVRDILPEEDGYRYKFDHKSVWFNYNFAPHVNAFVRVGG